MNKWSSLKKKWLEDPDFKQGYDALEPEYQLARSIIKARLVKKMTQAQLADKAGVGQAVIARLESGTANPTIGTVNRVASALGKALKLA